MLRSLANFVAFGRFAWSHENGTAIHWDLIFSVVDDLYQTTKHIIWSQRREHWKQIPLRSFYHCFPETSDFRSFTMLQFHCNRALEDYVQGFHNEALTESRFPVAVLLFCKLSKQPREHRTTQTAGWAFVLFLLFTKEDVSFLEQLQWGGLCNRMFAKDSETTKRLRYGQIENKGAKCGVSSDNSCFRW